MFDFVARHMQQVQLKCIQMFNTSLKTSNIFLLPAKPEMKYVGQVSMIDQVDPYKNKTIQPTLEKQDLKKILLTTG